MGFLLDHHLTESSGIIVNNTDDAQIFEDKQINCPIIILKGDIRQIILDLYDNKTLKQLPEKEPSPEIIKNSLDKLLENICCF